MNIAKPNGNLRRKKVMNTTMVTPIPIPLR
jgi:hypothetical protein